MLEALPGVVGYRGPSQLDGAPIFVALTHGSQNRKTGAMAQTWILREDLHPLDAVRTGADASICGTCRHRGQPSYSGRHVKRTCYVNVQHGPSQVYKSYKAGKYRDDFAWGSLPTPLAVRLGAYGDPAAVPIDVWHALVARATARTAYTHLWRTCPPAFREFCMASVDTADEKAEAQARGWRTFRVRTFAEPLARHEITCPASEEAGHRTTCLSCRLCMGASKPAADIAIQAHGPHQVHFFTSRHPLGFLS